MEHATRMVCRLALEDGTIAKGYSFGANADEGVCGEVVFNTAMCGYQEALTDPSYAGQILIMTATQMGNYGVNPEDVESTQPQVAGFVIKERSRTVSNYRADNDLGSWLSSCGIPAIEGVDTRALVRKIRLAGALRGVIATGTLISDQELVQIAQNSPEMSGQDLASTKTCEVQNEWNDSLGEWNMHADCGNERFRVAAIDCGAKHNIYRHLTSVGCDIMSLPNAVTVEEIRALNPDGLFVSNGPGDPAAVETTIELLRDVAGEFPTFGICLGHQMLALALGATTYKLKFGHRGANQPVRDVDTGVVEITSQNHGFCVDEASLEAVDCVVTHRHLNDDTVAGFRHLTKPIMGVQYHPEASPGPHDSAYLFERFIEMMKTAKFTVSE